MPLAVAGGGLGAAAADMNHGVPLAAAALATAQAAAALAHGVPLAGAGVARGAAAGALSVAGGGGLISDWQSRIAGPGVVWYHNFDSAAEVNQFRWCGGYAGGNDPLANAPDGPRVQWVSSGGADNGGHLRVTYPLGANTGSMYWYRPFNPLTGATNGRGVDDPAASGTIALSAFNVSDGSSTLYNWGLQPNPGWYMHPTHQASFPGKFQGHDFYYQARVRRAQTPGAPPDNPIDGYFSITGKSVWFTSTVSTYTAQELVVYGQKNGGPTNDSVGVQSQINIYSGQNFQSIFEAGGQPDQTVTLSPIGSGWRYTGGWDTLLFHVTPGTNGGTGANDTRVEVWAQRDLTLFPAEAGQYIKLGEVKFSGSFDLSSNSAGAPGLPGWNAVLCAIYHNGSQFTTSSFQYDYDQLIFSKNFIPAPQAAALPTWVPGSVGAIAQIPNSAMSSSPPSPVPPGNTGPQSKVIVWTSFTIDPRDSSVYSVANGGHHDYAGNEVSKLTTETNSPGWSMPRAPSNVGTPPDDVDYYSDGRPTSRHTYYGATFNPYSSAGQVMLWGGGRWGNGQFGDRGDAFNLSTNDYSAAGSFPNIGSQLNNVGGAYAVCADTLTGDVYFFGNFFAYRWNRAANTMTTLSSSTSVYGRNAASAFDSRRGRVFVVGGDNAHHDTWDTAGSSFTSRALTGAAASAVLGVVAGGMVYVPSRDSYLLCEGSAGTVYEINAGTFACTTFASFGVGTQNGPYNKFLYAPRLKGVIYVPEYGTNCRFLRVE